MKSDVHEQRVFAKPVTNGYDVFYLFSIENSMENSKVNASVEDGKPEEDANDKLVPEETMGNATNSKLENIFDSTSVDCDNCINNTQPDGSSSGAISTSTKLLVFTTYLSATTVGIAITLLFELL